MHYIYKEIMTDKIKDEARRFEGELISIIRDHVETRDFSLIVIIISYLLVKTAGKKLSYEKIINGKVKIDQEIINELVANINCDDWDQIVDRAKNYDDQVFTCLALITAIQMESLNEATPASIIKLSNEILKCSGRDLVADVCCGTGSFIVNQIISDSKAEVIGFEIDYRREIVTKIRIELLGADNKVVLGNVFETVPGLAMKFDRIFSNYPFGLGLRKLNTESEYINNLFANNPAFSKTTSSDWIFNSLLCDSLTNNGRAVAIITNGSTWNSIDKPARKSFVESGLIESVIALPKNMFFNTSIATSLIVFSHGNNFVRLVDASEIYVSGRRINTFSDENIETILDALEEDNSISKRISIEEIRDNDYSLHFGRYVGARKDMKNGVRFDSLIKRITRGAPCTAKELDSMSSEMPTNMQYLMLANIKNGLIEDDLPYLTTIADRYKKYCLKNNDLILSKNGYPYKVAVVTIEGERQILANGNLYIIEINEEQANPYYIKAFFDSEDGIAALRSITVGATIPNIGIEDLKSVMIPLPSLVEQERVARKYQAARDEVFMLKKRLDQAMNRLQHCFDDETEG